MIEYLLILLAIKYRDLLSFDTAHAGDIDRSLEPGAGIDFEPPQRERPRLRVVK